MARGGELGSQPEQGEEPQTAAERTPEATPSKARREAEPAKGKAMAFQLVANQQQQLKSIEHTHRRKEEAEGISPKCRREEGPTLSSVVQESLPTDTHHSGEWGVPARDSAAPVSLTERQRQRQRERERET